MSGPGHFDVAVVGGGHNGLTAAAYLARSGKRVVVLESREIVGGFCTSEQNVPEAPGFVMNPYSADHVLTNIPPTVDDQLDLSREGLRWVHPDPFYSYLHPNGTGFAFWRDVNRTAEEIARISKADAEAYLRFNAIMTALWRVAAPYLQGHPKRVAPKALGRILAAAAGGRSSLAPAVRIVLSSPGAVIEEWFESDEVRAALACFSVATMSGLDEPGSGIILSMMAVQHRWGVRRPVGGQSAFSEALACAARRHGAVVRTSSPVASVEVSGGRARAVVLADGERITADEVVVTVDPWTLAHRLLPGDALPEQTYRELRGMSVLRNGISAYKADVALSGRPELPRHGRETQYLGSLMLLASSLEAVRASTDAALVGELTDDVPIWLSTPSIQDRSLVPAGSSGETAYVFLPAVPYQLRHGSWAQEKQTHLERVVKGIEDYSPGYSDLIIGSTITAPDDLERISGLYRGHLFHVDMTLSQFGPWRPTPSLAGYRTPISGLFHAGAGNHPMGTVSGWSGRGVAAELLRRRRRG
jgi:beta-carotene ketolase (CrtO type)